MYIAPERLQYKSNINNFKSSDIWALGIIIYIILFNSTIWYSPEYKDRDFREYIDFITYNNTSYWDYIILETDLDKKYRTNIVDILNYCLKIDYLNRNEISYISKIINSN